MKIKILTHGLAYPRKYCEGECCLGRAMDIMKALSLCEWCGSLYSSDKSFGRPDERSCSLSCSIRLYRWRMGLE